MQFSSDGTVTITTDAAPVISYAQAHNGMPVVDQVSLTSTADLREAELSVEIADESGVLTRKCTRMVDLAAGGRTVVDGLRLQLDPARMKDVAERRRGQLTVRLTVSGDVVHESSEDVIVLPGRHWLATPMMLACELLPAFVIPNDPAVSALLGEAGDLLKARTGSPSIEGYQSGPERVDAIAEAIYDAARARNIRYAEPPASWESVGQLVRTPREVLEGRLGTCLDTVVVLAAALEQAGIRPLLWLVKGHAFLGYWRQEGASDAIAQTDANQAVNLADLGVIRLIETTSVTDREEAVPFSATHDQPFARYLTGDLDEVLAVVDVYTARRSGVIPLPAVTQQPTGEVTVVEYVPTVHSSPPSAPSAARPQMSTSTGTPVPPRIAQWKNALLDLSLRNRLINFTDRNGLALAVPDGHLGRVEDLLHDSGALSLWPSDHVDNIAAARGVRFGRDLPQDQLADLLVSKRTVFSDVTESAYATRMRNLAYKARTIVEETGANNLYLALGTLAWEWEGKPLRSPLVLVPVTLTSPARQNAYRLELDESGTSTPNFCLLEKLGQLGVRIPGLAEPELDGAGINLDAALQAVRVAVAGAGRPWRVEPTAHLAILQFAKFRLWKDLDEHWEAMLANPLVSHLVHSPTEAFTDPVDGAVTTDLDELAGECPISADASQLRAIADALAGRTLVLEGPPGTGKSQTITNLLSRAIADGRRVLFVAEKRAALDVVQKRLDAVGMGPFSLDLHDKGSKPVQVRAQIRAALEHSVDVDAAGLSASEEDLRTSRRQLSRYATRLHEANPAGRSMYSAHEELLALGDGPVLEVPSRVLSRGVDELAGLRHRLGLLPDVADPARPQRLHPWGFVRTTSLPDGRVDEIRDAVRAVDSALDRLAVPGPFARALAEARGLDDLATLSSLAATPSVTLHDLDSTRQPSWDTSNESLAREIGAFVAASHPGLDVVTPAAMDLPLADIHSQAQSAAASGFWGRKKRLLAVLDLLTPALRPGAVVKPKPKDVVALTGALVQVQGSVRGLADQAGRVPGIAVPAGWNPLTDEGRGLLDRQVQWLRWAGRSIAQPYGAAGGFTGAVRAWLSDRGVASSSAATDAAELRAAVERLVSLTGADDASLTAWSGELSFVRAWDQTRRGRDLEDDQQLPLRRWVALLEHLDPLRAAGMEAAARLLETGAVDAAEAVKAFDRGVATASAAERRTATGLDAFDPVVHERSISRFVAASASVRDLMAQELPRRAVGSRSFDATTARGQVGALQRELNKQRRGLGVRALLQQYGALITQVMPCVLVSPDSLARFFPVQPGLFDLVVFDEASQIRVADAMGAMGRAESVVVVGDSKQMPPTSFAEVSLQDDEESVPDGVIAVEDEESILSEAVLARVPQQWLSWHYRSQDESLISFSNQHYYDQRLSSFPAPRIGSADPGPNGHGISLVRVDGHFHRSGKGKLLRTNPVEAEAVVAELRRRFAAAGDGTYPSVGVVTFNMQQRAYIEALLRDSGDDRFREALDDPDGLFIKNLENVQGDERDTILFSTAFSVNDKGVLPLNFGPLNRGGGERRLNVAVTRARRQVVVFSSFDPGQLRAEETSAVGIKHLRAYLDLAAAGAEETTARRRPGVVDRHREEIADALRARGHVVTTEIGLSDFRVDISVARVEDPDQPRLAVLLDGPAWARRQTVGDRDGLPVEVLSRLMGWPAVERVWLPEWVADESAVVTRLEDALRRPAEEPRAAAPTPPARPTAALRPTESPAVRESVAAPVRSQSPEPADYAPLNKGEPFAPWSMRQVSDRSWLDALPQSRAADTVRKVALEVIAAEGPIHEVRLARLVASAFDLNRVNDARIRSILRTVPNSLRGTEEATFYWPNGRSESGWEGFRTPTPADPRQIEDVSLREIGNAMHALCVAGFGLAREELLREALAVFGGKRLTPAIRTRVESALSREARMGRLVEVNGVISAG